MVELLVEAGEEPLGVAAYAVELAAELVALREQQLADGAAGDLNDTLSELLNR